MSKLLSIIVPVYNVEKHIVQCLESITTDLVDINRECIEVILINDCTPDNSMKKCKSIIDSNKDIIKVFNHDENLGLGGARNTGIDNAHGRYITFLDSDDYYKKGAINKLIEITSTKSPNDIFIFGFEALENKIVQWGFTPEANKTIPADEGLILLSEDKINPSVWNKIFPKKCLSELRFSPHVYYEDIEFTPRAFQLADKVVFINKTLLNYRLDGISITRSKTREKHVEDLAQIIMKMAAHIDEKKVVSNLFFNRWGYHLNKWSLNQGLADLSLKKIKEFTDKHSLDQELTNSFLRFKMAFEKLTIKYANEENLPHINYIKSNIKQMEYHGNPEQVLEIIRENEHLKLELKNLIDQKEWYERTYEGLPWWWKKIGALIRRLK